jgi:SAM-dependent methyltransferase
LSTTTIKRSDYDDVGHGYRAVRAPDPRFAERIEQALGDAVSVVNVGAGAGSYESPLRKVVAVEPSEVMIRQRPAGAAPALRGVAEALPFLDASVDAATAFLTVHHWSDPGQGLREMRRIARRRVVVLTYVPAIVDPMRRWLTGSYFPSLGALVHARFPSPALYRTCLGEHELRAVPVPADCTDGFLDAYWARPESYLDPAVRAGIFWFREIPAPELATGLRRLEQDLRDGSWDATHGALRAQREHDVGLRLVIA